MRGFGCGTWVALLGHGIYVNHLGGQIHLWDRGPRPESNIMHRFAGRHISDSALLHDLHSLLAIDNAFMGCHVA